MKAKTEAYREPRVTIRIDDHVSLDVAVKNAGLAELWTAAVTRHPNKAT